MEFHPKKTSDQGPSSHVGLSRDLGLLDVTMIGVGAMIGAGIFVLTGIAAGAAGPALVLSFALNGIITVFTAMVYAELGSAIPEAGGGYLWVKEGLPGPNAFLAGWMSWFAHAVAGSLYGLGFGSYLRLVLSEAGFSLDGIPQDLVHKGFAVLIILIFVFINYRGSSETGLAGNIATFIKIAILLVFIASGLWVVLKEPASHMQHFTDFAPEGFAGILNAMGLTFIAFEGYEIIVQAGEETRNPRKTIPKAVFYSLAIVVPIYMLVAFVSIGAVDTSGDQPTYAWLGEHKELGLVEAARQFMPFGTILLLVGGLFSTMSALNATTYSSTRVSFAMGRDKNLPEAFARIHDRTRTPHQALAFTAGLILFMSLAIPIKDVASAADIMFLLLFLQVNVAVISIRRQYGKRLRYGYLMPFFPIIPLIGIVTKLFLAVFMFNYSAVAWYFVLGWTGLGLLIYYLYVRWHKEDETRTPLVARAEKRPSPGPREGYRVLVPIAAPESLAVLVPPAVEAARRRNGSLLFLHVIQVPRQLPLSAGRAYVGNRQSLIDKALAMVPDDVPAEALVRVAHHAARAIIDTVREFDADLFIMGWRGERKHPDTAIGRNIDRIIRTVNSDVIVVQQTEPPPFRNILVPVAGAAEVDFALRAAGYIAADAARIDVLHVFPPDVEPAAREAFMEKLQGAVDAFCKKDGREGASISVRDATGASPVHAIIDAGKAYDGLIMGASTARRLKDRFFDNMPARIARGVRAPVLLVRPEANTLRFGVGRLAAFFRGDSAAGESSDLEEAGLLRPASEEKDDRHTGVNTPGILATGLAAVAAGVAIYVGQGEALTWIGAGVFLLALAVFTWLSTRGVDRLVE